MRKDTRFKFTLGVFTLALATLLAAQPPAWWSSSSSPVVDPNATTTGIDQNYAPANLGQLKFIAMQAKLHLDSNLNGGSGTAITSLVSGFTPQDGVSYTQAELDAFRAANYAPINLGQLKAVAKPFYDRLDSAGYNTKANLIARGFPDKWSGTDAWSGYYPWNPLTPKADNYAPANLGQLKMVFSFDLSGFDSDGDGMPDTWEIAHGFNPEDNSDASPTADADGDGLSNLDEFQQNSDPNNYYSQGSETITPVVSISDGNNQSGSPGSFLPEPIKVSVTNADGGAPLVGAPVSFTAATGAGGLASEASSYSADTSIIVPTDSNGVATAYWKLGANPGFQQVAAQSGSAPAVTFSATSLPADGRWGHWRFLEGTGTTAADTSGFGHPGTLTNSPTWVAGQNADGALSFSGATTEGGTNDYVTMGNPADRSLDFGEDSFTMAVWVKFTTAAIAPGQFGRRIVSKGHHGWNAGYCLGINSNGSFFAGVGTTLSGQGTQCVFVWTQDAFNDGQWHHLAAVFDRATSTARILVDGVRQDLVNEALAGGTVVDSKLLDFSALQSLSATRTDMPLTIGSHIGQYDFYKGELDDVRLYRRALSDEEIAAICGQTGLLKALAQTVTLAEDTLGTISLKSQGGADSGVAGYEIVTPPENGVAVLDGSTIIYYPNAHYNGSDNLTFRATKGSQTSDANISITITPENDAPLVSVGGSQSITITDSASLVGNIIDIDTPTENIVTHWVKVSGPGVVSFEDAGNISTTATFEEEGTYVLKLVASDGASVRSDSLIIAINSATVGNLGAIALQEPDANSFFLPGEQINVAAEVTPAPGQSIVKVEFYEGSRKIAEATTPAPSGNLYSANWTPSRLGAYAVSAIYTDSTGARKASQVHTVAVSLGSWFSGNEVNAGNEGYAGSGGNGGIGIGASLGAGTGYEQGTGANGAGKTAGGGGDGFGNSTDNSSDLDSDGDGLTDAEELALGSNPQDTDSDGDKVLDGIDADPLDLAIRWNKASETRYAIITLSNSSNVVPIGLGNDYTVVAKEGTSLNAWRNGQWSSMLQEVPTEYRYDSSEPDLGEPEIHESADSYTASPSRVIVRDDGSILAAGGNAMWSNVNQNPTYVDFKDIYIYDFTRDEIGDILTAYLYYNTTTTTFASRSGFYCYERAALETDYSQVLQDIVVKRAPDGALFTYDSASATEWDAELDFLGLSESGKLLVKYYGVYGEEEYSSVGVLKLYQDGNYRDLPSAISSWSNFSDTPGGGLLVGNYIESENGWAKSIHTDIPKLNAQGAGISTANSSELWRNGKNLPLNSLTGSTAHIKGIDINDSGAILATVTEEGEQEAKAALLVPFDVVREATPGSGTFGPIKDNVIPIFASEIGRGEIETVIGGNSMTAVFSEDLGSTSLATVNITYSISEEISYTGLLTETGIGTGVFSDSSNATILTLTPANQTTSSASPTTLNGEITIPSLEITTSYPKTIFSGRG